MFLRGCCGSMREDTQLRRQVGEREWLGMKGYNKMLEEKFDLGAEVI